MLAAVGVNLPVCCKLQQNTYRTEEIKSAMEAQDDALEAEEQKNM